MSNLRIAPHASAFAAQQMQTVAPALAQSAYQRIADALQAASSPAGGTAHHDQPHAGEAAVESNVAAGSAAAPARQSGLNIVA